MVRRLKSAQEGIPFLDILLDETICEGEILAPEELVRAAGGINENDCGRSKNMNCFLELHSNRQLFWRRFLLGHLRMDM